MNTSATPAYSASSPVTWMSAFVIAICLATLGGLCGGLVFAVLGTLLGVVGLSLLALLLAHFNSETRRRHGFPAIGGAVAQGFVLLVPFAVLAAVVWFWLRWDAAQTFAVAGLMAAGAATGGEMAKIGADGGRLLPLLWSVLLSLVWMLLSIAVSGAIV
jgi:hypothetical protein